MELTAVEIITLCTRHHAQIALNLACIWKVKGENRVSFVTASEVQKLRIKETNCIYICRMSIKEGITHTSYMYYAQLIKICTLCRSTEPREKKKTPVNVHGIIHTGATGPGDLVQNK